MYMKHFMICFEVRILLINIVHLCSYIGLYYVVRDVLIPRYFDQKRWWAFGAGLVGWTAVVFLMWSAAMYFLALYYEMPRLTIPQTFGAYMLEIVQMYVPGMILLAWESFDDAEDEAKRLHLMEREQIATELNYLKAKVNPQFIFNTLKNLKTFVDQKSNKAPDMILRLSEVLDYVLYRSQQDLLKLNEEVDVISRFIELEQLRLGDRLDINLRTSGDLSVDIAPLTLLSVVENALKESIINQSDYLHVDIHIGSSAGKVTCIINIKKDESFKVQRNGLSEIKRQLALTYPDRHSLSHIEDSSAIITSLTLMAAS